MFSWCLYSCSTYACACARADDCAYACSCAVAVGSADSVPVAVRSASAQTSVTQVHVSQLYNVQAHTALLYIIGNLYII